MFTAILINATAARRQMMSAIVFDSGLLTLQHSTDHYPTPLAVSGLCRQFGTDLYFLDLEEPEDATACLACLRDRCPNTPVIGVGGTQTLQRSFAAKGVSHFLPFPADFVAFATVVAQAMRSQAAKPLDNLIAFLPSKAGSGSSTVALCTATILAAELNVRTLCIDADLRSGILSAIVGQAPGASTQSALARSDELDDLHWHGFVHSNYGVDFLLAIDDPERPLPQWTNYFRLLQFVQSRYEAIIVDLPELVNSATEEIVRRAQTVFIVTTQEPYSLHLAKRRLKELDRWGIPSERIRIVVNRWNRHDTPVEEIKAILGNRIAACLPNNYPALRAALQAGHLPLPDTSEPGRSLRKFAQMLVGCEQQSTLQQALQWAAGLSRFLVSNS